LGFSTKINLVDEMYTSLCTSILFLLNKSTKQAKIGPPPPPPRKTRVGNLAFQAGEIPLLENIFNKFNFFQVSGFKLLSEARSKVVLLHFKITNKNFKEVFMSKVSFSKITKWLVSVLMVMSVVFFVGCSKDDDKKDDDKKGGGDGIVTFQNDSDVKLTVKIFKAGLLGGEDGDALGTKEAGAKSSVKFEKLARSYEMLTLTYPQSYVVKWENADGSVKGTANASLSKGVTGMPDIKEATIVWDGSGVELK